MISGYSDSITTGNSFLTLVNPVLSGNSFAIFRTQSIGTGVIGAFSLTLVGGLITLGASSADFIYRTESGQFYPNSNPSGFPSSVLITTGLNNYPIVLNNLGKLSGTSSIGWDNTNQTLEIGITGLTYPSNPILMTNNTNSYYQINIQNLSTGVSGSSDYIATSDNGSDSNFYIDFGINSSKYSETGYALYGPNDGYLYVNGGDLFLGTSTTGIVSFHVSGTQLSNKILDITLSGINLGTGKSIYDVSGSTYSQVKVTGSNSIQTPIFSGIGNSQVLLSGNNVLISGYTLTFFQKNVEITSTGLAGATIYRMPVFRANTNCTLTGIHANRIGGTSGQISAFKNNNSGTFHCGYITSATGSWTSTGTIISGAYVPGDALYVIYSGIAGLPTDISVQFDFTSP